MEREHEKAVLSVMVHGISHTVGDLFDATGLTAPYLDAALQRLVQRGQVTKVAGGRFKLMDHVHSRAVKRGQFVKGIPQLALLLCGYGAVAFPVVDIAEGWLWSIL